MDKIVGQVRRLAPHNRDWFTEGKIYDMDNHGKVLDDNGKERTPYYDPEGNLWTTFTVEEF